MKKLTITECRQFLKEKKNIKYKNLYNMINKYVDKYNNYESQYLISTSSKYQDEVERRKLEFYKSQTINA
tara:strand:- start:358 stop:567 length:210 start_codon:yes stop_codon:yes gene_type:complete